MLGWLLRVVDRWLLKRISSNRLARSRDDKEVKLMLAFFFLSEIRLR